MKPQRHIDSHILDMARNRACLVCNRRGPSDPHHLRSRGAGGGDYEWNVVSLCRSCHTEIHKLGTNRFLEKYGRLRDWMIDRGWVFEAVRGKWAYQK